VTSTLKKEEREVDHQKMDMGLEEVTLHVMILNYSIYVFIRLRNLMKAHRGLVVYVTEFPYDTQYRLSV
jgi:hypothetical protein